MGLTPVSEPLSVSDPEGQTLVAIGSAPSSAPFQETTGMDLKKSRHGCANETRAKKARASQCLIPALPTGVKAALPGGVNWHWRPNGRSRLKGAIFSQVPVRQALQLAVSPQARHQPPVRPQALQPWLTLSSFRLPFCWQRQPLPQLLPLRQQEPERHRHRQGPLLSAAARP